MTKPADQRCENCLFWEKLPNDREQRGECNRNAPLPVMATHADFETPVSPRTLPTRWCGEWKKTT